MFIARNFEQEEAADPSAVAHEIVKFTASDDENITGIFAENMFTRTSYLRALGHDFLVMSRGAGLPPALLSDRKTHLVSLDALGHVTRSEVQRRSALLFQQTTADFIVFEDVLIDAGDNDPPCPGQEFRYKANWRRDMSSGPPFMSSKQASALRRKLKKLNALFGSSEPEFGFRRTRPGDVAAIVDLNRTKIERDGRRYRMSDAKLSAMEILCAEIGYTATLSGNGELLAGNIVCVAGNCCFFPLLGHDLTYEKYSPGSQVTSMALEELARMGCTQANFLWGDSRWKADFRAKREDLATIVIRRSGRVMVSRDYRRVVVPLAIAAAKAALKPRLKRLLGNSARGGLLRLLRKR